MRQHLGNNKKTKQWKHTCKQTASTGGVHSARSDMIMLKAVGLLAISSDRSIRAPPPPASADWSIPPVDIADTNKHTYVCVQRDTSIFKRGVNTAAPPLPHLLVCSKYLLENRQKGRR